MIIVEVPIEGWPKDKPYVYAANTTQDARDYRPKKAVGEATAYEWDCRYKEVRFVQKFTL